MPGFTKADVNLLVRVEKNLRTQITHEEAMVDGAPTLEVRERLLKRDRLLRDEREVQVLRERVRQHLPAPTPKTLAT